MNSSNYTSSLELLFQYNPIPLWEFDYTALFLYFEKLKKQKIDDLSAYLKQHPEELNTFISLSKIKRVNQAVLNLCEADSVEDIYDYSRFFTKNTYAVLVEYMGKLYQESDSYSADSELISSSGKIKFIRLKLHVHHDIDTNKFTGILATEDITELKNQEQQFKEIIALSPDSITISRISDGKFVFINDTFKKGLGFSEEELRTKSAYELGMWVNESDRNTYLDKIEKEGSVVNLPAAFRTKKGQIRESLLSARKINYLGKPHIIVNSKDVTDLNELRRLLEKKEEQFRKAFMNIPDAFQINKVSDGTFVDVNDVFIKYTGFKREELIGKTPEDINIWVDDNSNRSFYRRLKKDNNLTNFETIFRMKDGTLLNTFISASIVELNGEPHIITITKDISEFKEAQEEIKRSEEKFQTIFTESPDFLAILDIDTGIYIDVNKKFVEASGFSRDEIIGKTSTELKIWATPEERNFFNSLLENKKEIVNHKSIFLLKNGQQIHLLISSKLIEISGKQHYLIIAKNIDNFIKIQAELFEKENRYKAIVSNSYEGIVIIDHRFNFDYINHQMEIITGYTSDELLGMDFRKILTPESALLVGKRYKDRQLGSEVPQHYQFEIRRKNGDIRIVEIHSSVIATTDGNPQTIAQLLDITDRVLANKTIEKEHKRARQYFEVAGMIMLALDTEGKITAINKKGCEVIEAKENEIIGKNWFTEFIPNNMQEKLSAQFKNSIAKESEDYPYFENIIRTSNGKEKLIAWRNSLLRNEKNQVIGLLSSGEDISAKEETSRILNMSGIVAILWRNETDSPIEFISENAEHLLGYTAEEIYAKKLNYKHFIHPDDVEKLRTETKEITLSKKGHFTHQPYRIITKSGEIKWVSDRTTAQMDSEGNITSFYGVLSDISEDIIKGEKLRQSNEILSQMNDGVVITDFKGNINEWSGGAEAMFGYKNEEIIEQNISLLWHPDIQAQDQLDVILTDIEVTGVYQRKIECLNKNGQIIPIELTAKILLDSAGNPLSLILVNRDITNREIARKALENSERRYRHIFESILDGVIIYNMNKEIVEVNKMATQMYGYSYDEFSQTETSRFIHPVQNHDFDDVLNHLDNDYSKMFEGESVDITKSGNKFFVNAKGRLIYYNNKPHLLIIVRDITKIKQAEHELFKAKEKAIESEKLKSAFLANMSHEIRTPMNSIIGFSDLIADEDIDPQEKKQFLHIIRQNGNQLMNIINDIIDISKIEAGQIKLNYEFVDLCETIQDIYNMFILNTKEKGIDLIKSSSRTEKEYLVKTDELRLKQILINLVSNAIKFTKQGSIEFGFKVTDNEKSLHFYVKDSGIGIPKDKQNEIFQRFMQAELQTTKLYGGTGLGLAISQGLVHTFKGKMWLESDEGIGSTFNFKLPLILE